MKICIIQRILPHYRVKFFINLQRILKKKNIELVLIYGQESPGTVPKSASCDEVWAHKINNKYIKIFGKEIVWQPCLGYISNADLIIIEQSNRLLVNSLLQWKLNRKYNLAYWGHGRNLQGNRRSIFERYKKYISKYVDWWFAYTEKSVSILSEIGFDINKITLVNNAIDNSELIDHIKNFTSDDLINLKENLNITTNNVAIYCGGMYANKSIAFLLESCEKIKKLQHDFEVIFIGSGPDAIYVEKAAVNNPWIHYVGEQYGQDRVGYFLLSKVMLMPGAVGLAVVDSFILKVPLFTTDITTHGPEIAYLINGENGIITNHKTDSYAEQVASYLKDESLQAKLKSGCSNQSSEITLDNMVDRFASGILNAAKS